MCTQYTVYTHKHGDVVQVVRRFNAGNSVALLSSGLASHDIDVLYVASSNAYSVHTYASQ